MPDQTNTKLIDIGASLVNGMSEPDPSGSYVLISVASKIGTRKSFLISTGAAEVLVAELTGLLTRNLQEVNIIPCGWESVS